MEYMNDNHVIKHDKARNQQSQTAAPVSKPAIMMANRQQKW